MHSGRIVLCAGIWATKTSAALDAKMTVLPEVFKAAGYRTGAFGKWGLGHTHLAGATNPLSHGFDEYYGWKSQSGRSYVLSLHRTVHNGREVAVEKRHLSFMGRLMEHARAISFGAVACRRRSRFFVTSPPPSRTRRCTHRRSCTQKWRKVFPQFDKKIGRYGAGGEACPNVVNPIAGFAAMMEHLDNESGRSCSKLLDRS